MIRKLLPNAAHEEIAGRRSRDLAADDDTIAGDKDFLDVELLSGIDLAKPPTT